MKIVYTNIQHLSTQDGPGIRTTVFLKGCNLRCPWCSNPENLIGEIQYYYLVDKCYFRSHGVCYNQRCPMRTSQEIPYGKSNLKCMYGALGQYGKYIEPQELAQILMEDYDYWQGHGGVTFSGGEALLQMKPLSQTMSILKRNDVHIAVETAFHIPEKNAQMAMEYVDLFFIDVKVLDMEIARKVLNGDVKRFYSNVEALSMRNKEVIFRVPCNDEIVLQEYNMELLLDFFKEYRCYPVEIFAIHSLGERKYKSLNKNIVKFTSSRVNEFYQKLLNQGNNVNIIKI